MYIQQLCLGPKMYKIKLHQSGYRFAYSIADQTITVTVITISKRNRNEITT